MPVAAVVIMACNRADYLERTINSVLKYVHCILCFVLLTQFFIFSADPLAWFSIFQISKFCCFEVSCLCIPGTYIYRLVIAVLQIKVCVMGMLDALKTMFLLKLRFWRDSLPSMVAFIFSQDGSHPGVRSKALSYDQLTYMQVTVVLLWSCFSWSNTTG